MILVTGSTGTVGTELVHQFAAAGERPRALVRDLEKARQRLGDEAEFVKGDLRRPEIIESALDGIDRVFLLTSTSTEQFDHERNVIEAAQRAGVDHLVKLSVLGASEDSPLHHARWQRRADRLLEESGVDYTILQMAFLMQTLFGMVNGGAICTAAGDGRVAMIDARDVAAVAAAVLTKHGSDVRGKTYALTGPESLNFDDTASTLSETIGLQIRHIRVTSANVASAIRRFRKEDWYAEDVAAFNDLIAAGYAEPLTDHVRDLTGVDPRSLAEFTRDYKGAFFRQLQPAQYQPQ